MIADRVVVLGEDGDIVADGAPATILADRELLIRANLIHEHLHEHGALAHSHQHVDAEGHHDGRAANPDDRAAGGGSGETVDPAARTIAGRG